MFDCRGKQGIGLMLGVFSIVIPYAPFLALRALLDIATLFVILIIGLVIGTIGIIVSSISLKEAGELGISEILAYQASRRGGFLHCRLTENGRITISGAAALVAVSEIVAEL